MRYLINILLLLSCFWPLHIFTANNFPGGIANAILNKQIVAPLQGFANLLATNAALEDCKNFLDRYPFLAQSLATPTKTVRNASLFDVALMKSNRQVIELLASYIDFNGLKYHTVSVILDRARREPTEENEKILSFVMRRINKKTVINEAMQRIDTQNTEQTRYNLRDLLYYLPTQEKLTLRTTLQLPLLLFAGKVDNTNVALQLVEQSLEWDVSRSIKMNDVRTIQTIYTESLNILPAKIPRPDGPDMHPLLYALSVANTETIECLITQCNALKDCLPLHHFLFIRVALDRADNPEKALELLLKNDVKPSEQHFNQVVTKDVVNTDLCGKLYEILPPNPYHAIIMGDWEGPLGLKQQILDNPKIIHDCDKVGTTLISFAARNNQTEIFEHLVTYHGDHFAKTSLKKLSEMVDIVPKQRAAIEKFIHDHTQSNPVLRQQSIDIFTAICTNNIPALQQALAHHPEDDLFMFALTNGATLETLQTLMAANVNPIHPDNSGRTAIHLILENRVSDDQIRPLLGYINKWAKDASRSATEQQQVNRLVDAMNQPSVMILMDTRSQFIKHLEALKAEKSSDQEKLIIFSAYLGACIQHKNPFLFVEIMKQRCPLIGFGDYNILIDTLKDESTRAEFRAVVDAYYKSQKDLPNQSPLSINTRKKRNGAQKKSPHHLLSENKAPKAQIQLLSPEQKQQAQEEKKTKEAEAAKIKAANILNAKLRTVQSGRKVVANDNNEEQDQGPRDCDEESDDEKKESDNHEPSRKELKDRRRNYDSKAKAAKEEEEKRRKQEGVQNLLKKQNDRVQEQRGKKELADRKVYLNRIAREAMEELQKRTKEAEDKKQKSDALHQEIAQEVAPYAVLLSQQEFLMAELLELENQERALCHDVNEYTNIIEELTAAAQDETCGDENKQILVELLDAAREQFKLKAPQIKQELKAVLREINYTQQEVEFIKNKIQQQHAISEDIRCEVECERKMPTEERLARALADNPLTLLSKQIATNQEVSFHQITQFIHRNTDTDIRKLIKTLRKNNLKKEHDFACTLLGQKQQKREKLHTNETFDDTYDLNYWLSNPANKQPHVKMPENIQSTYTELQTFVDSAKSHKAIHCVASDFKQRGLADLADLMRSMHQQKAFPSLQPPLDQLFAPLPSLPTLNPPISPSQPEQSQNRLNHLELPVVPPGFGMPPMLLRRAAPNQQLVQSHTLQAKQPLQLSYKQ